jgi:hypothetical protein
VRRLSEAKLQDRSAWPEGIDLRAVAAAHEALQRAVTPGDGRCLAIWCQFLIERYRMRPDTPAFGDMEARVWLTVLGHWPDDVIEAAVVGWCGDNRPFAPAVPGELKPYGEPILIARRALERRAALMLSAPPLEEKRYVSAAQFAQLGRTLARIGKPAAPSVSALARRFQQPPRAAAPAEAEEGAHG